MRESVAAGAPRPQERERRLSLGRFGLVAEEVLQLVQRDHQCADPVSGADLCVQLSSEGAPEREYIYREERERERQIDR